MFRKVNSFKERLREAIIAKNMSQSELSRLTGIGRNSISDYLKGKYEAKQDKIYIIAKVLNVSEAWLLGYDVSSERPTDEERHLNQNEQIIAAHIKDDVTDEEMKEIVNFIEYIKSKRNTNSNSDK
ncbi:predicted protein [Staphylococcus aureus A9635]|nr:predicted protein [Staphylococcus aureus A9635]